MRTFGIELETTEIEVITELYCRDIVFVFDTGTLKKKEWYFKQANQYNLVTIEKRHQDHSTPKFLKFISRVCTNPDEFLMETCQYMYFLGRILNKDDNSRYFKKNTPLYTASGYILGYFLEDLQFKWDRRGLTFHPQVIYEVEFHSLKPLFNHYTSSSGWCAKDLTQYGLFSDMAYQEFLSKLQLVNSDSSKLEDELRNLKLWSLLEYILYYISVYSRFNQTLPFSCIEEQVNTINFPGLMSRVSFSAMFEKLAFELGEKFNNLCSEYLEERSQSILRINNRFGTDRLMNWPNLIKADVPNVLDFICITYTKNRRDLLEIYREGRSLEPFFTPIGKYIHRYLTVKNWINSIIDPDGEIANMVKIELNDLLFDWARDNFSTPIAESIYNNHIRTEKTDLLSPPLGESKSMVMGYYKTAFEPIIEVKHWEKFFKNKNISNDLTEGWIMAVYQELLIAANNWKSIPSSHRCETKQAFINLSREIQVLKKTVNETTGKMSEVTSRVSVENHY